MLDSPTIPDLTAALVDTISPATLGVDKTRIATRIMRELAHGEPVPLPRVAAIAGTDLPTVEEAIAGFERMGFAELDDGRNIVGMAVSLAPTRHKFRVNGRQLYAWCALDTLFLPAVLEASAYVESICPVSGDTIGITVGPDGIEESGYSAVHLSVVAPGLTPGVTAECGSALAGREGAFCHQVNYLASATDAMTWLAEHPGAVVLPIDEAFDLATRVWADPFVAAA